MSVYSQEHLEIDSLQSCRSQLFQCSSPASSSSGRQLVVHTCSALPVASRRLPNRNNIGVIHPELSDLETQFLPSVSWLSLLPNTHTHTQIHTQRWLACSLTRDQRCAASNKRWFLPLSLLAHSDPVWVTDHSPAGPLGKMKSTTWTHSFSTPPLELRRSVFQCV